MTICRVESGHAVYWSNNFLVDKTWYWRVFGETDFSNGGPLKTRIDVDHDPSRRRLPEYQGRHATKALSDRVSDAVKHAVL